MCSLRNYSQYASLLFFRLNMMNLQSKFIKTQQFLKIAKTQRIVFF